MPCFQTKTTVAISPEQEQRLKTRFGQAVALLPGKSEHWLMLTFEGGSHIWFQGSNAQPAAWVQVSLFGAASPDDYASLTRTLSDILQQELGIAPARVYIKYEETSAWGWNGANF